MNKHSGKNNSRKHLGHQNYKDKDSEMKSEYKKSEMDYEDEESEAEADSYSEKQAAENGCGSNKSNEISGSGVVSESDADKKSSKFLIIALAAIIIVILAIFLFGKYLYDPKTSDKYNYNGFEFTKAGNTWNTELLKNNKLYLVPLHYGPRDVDGIPLKGRINDSFYADDIYITFDPEKEDLTYVALSAGELSLNLVQALGYTPVAACTKNLTDACALRPIVNCDTPDVSVIYLSGEGYPGVEFDNRCIIVRGNGTDLVKSTDRLILQWYGVIRPQDFTFS